MQEMNVKQKWLYSRYMRNEHNFESLCILFKAVLEVCSVLMISRLDFNVHANLFTHFI